MDTSARLRDDARELYKLLRDKGWTTSKDIQKALGMGHRKVRTICQEYAPYFASNSTDGYNVLANCTDAEIEHSIRDLRSRADKMTTRADALQSELNKRMQNDLYDGRQS